MVGFIGAGKGTTASILCEKHNFEQMAFAGTLKDATAAIFEWPRDLLEGDTAESRDFRETIDPYWSKEFGFDVTPRLMLQRVGTEAMRHGIHDGVWISSLGRKIDSSTKNVVITDVRFPNEIKMIHERGGFVVRIRRGPDPVWFEDATRENFMKTYHPDVHPSEWSWVGTPLDYILHNDSSISELESQISHMMKVFIGPTGDNQLHSTK